jgi:hypothetical protein
LRGDGLGPEHGPVGDIAVPLDKRWNRPAPADDDIEELPHRIGDGTVVTVDEQKVAFVIALFGVTGQMNLADTGERKAAQIFKRRKTVIDRRYEDIVDVKQQPASGALSNGANEVGFTHRRLVKRDIGRRVLKQDGTADRLLHFVDMIADARERRFGVRQRQKIIEKGRLMRRPGKMF